MEAELEVKEPHEITLENPTLDLVEPIGGAELVAEAEEKLTHINSSYTLNDYVPSKRICQYLRIRYWYQRFSRSDDQRRLPPS